MSSAHTDQDTFQVLRSILALVQYFCLDPDPSLSATEESKAPQLSSDGDWKYFSISTEKWLRLDKYVI